MIVKTQNLKMNESWNKVRELANEVYMITRYDPFSSDFELKDNIRRICMVLISKIAEGLTDSSDELLLMSLKHINVLTSQIRSYLYLALKLSYISYEEYDKIEMITVEINGLIASMMNNLVNQ